MGVWLVFPARVAFRVSRSAWLKLLYFLQATYLGIKLPPFFCSGKKKNGRVVVTLLFYLHNIAPENFNIAGTITNIG